MLKDRRNNGATPPELQKNDRCEGVKKTITPHLQQPCGEGVQLKLALLGLGLGGGSCLDSSSL